MSKKLVYGLLTEECFQTFFSKLEFLNVPCLKALISKVLSYAILLGSLIIKVPQILKLLPSKQKGKKDSGLSPSMFILETIGYSIVFAFHFRHMYPINTYGENISLLVQNYTIIFLLYSNRGRINATFFVGVLAYIAYFYVLLFPLPLEILALAQRGSIFIFSGSRLPQIYKNFRDGSTGQLSLFMVFLSWAGSLARMFTTIQELGGDFNVLFSYGVGASLNGILLLQIVLYWGKKAPGKME